MTRGDSPEFRFGGLRCDAIEELPRFHLPAPQVLAQDRCLGVIRKLLDPNRLTLWQPCGVPNAPASHSIPDSSVPSSGDVARTTADAMIANFHAARVSPSLMITRSPDPPAAGATAGSSGRGPWRS